MRNLLKFKLENVWANIVLIKRFAKSDPDLGGNDFDCH